MQQIASNIIENQAEWLDKTKGLSYLIVVNNPQVIDEWMKVLGRQGG